MSSNSFFNSSKYEDIDELKLSTENLELELKFLRSLKTQFKRTLDDIDTQMIRFRAESRKRKEEILNNKLYGE